MAVYGAFVSSTLGMMSQSHSLNTISSNLANINTGGYKANETRFSTVLSKTLGEQSDLGGIRVKDFQRIDKQGNLVSSDRELDVAISGKGFFILKTELTGGKTYYGRDGSFSIGTPGLTGTAIADDGSSLTIKQGFLVDKNGFFVQGRAAKADGTFPTTGALTSLRVDQFAFAAAGKATTTASLDLNLPSLDSAGDPQIERVTLGGTVEAADTYSVTVNATTITYTVTGAEANIGAIRDALVTAINANTTVSAAITAAANGDDSITLTAKKPGTAFSASTATVNNGGTADNTAVSINAQPNKVAANPRVFNAKAYDSNGKLRTAVLNFEKTSTQNQWNLTVTTDRDAVAQIDTVTLAGSVEGTDTFSATVNGTIVTYTVTGTELNIDAIRDGLISAINGNTTVSGVVTAAAGTGAGQLTLTAKTAGTSFTSSVATTQVVANVAQSDSITIGGTFEVGDIYTATVNGTAIPYTSIGGDTNATVATNLAALINANPAVTATAVGTDITVSAATAGTSYTLSAVGATGGVNLTQTATAAVVTANVTALTDNTIAKATTTANVTPTVTSSPVTLTFSSKGLLTSPTTAVTITATWPGTTAPASIQLDVSGFTQFAGDFLPVNYVQNGFGASDIRSLSFNTDGEIVASFEDSTNRPIYKVPLAVFSNPNTLERKNGNVFAETSDSGTAKIITAGNSGFAQFAPNTLELSNVDLADQFTKMIITQGAYNSAATVFKTVDELLMTARDLKR